MRGAKKGKVRRTAGRECFEIIQENNSDDFILTFSSFR